MTFGAGLETDPTCAGIRADRRHNHDRYQNGGRDDRYCLLDLHHVTAIAGDPQRNVDFYTDVLGLRLAQRPVIQFDAMLGTATGEGLALELGRVVNIQRLRFSHSSATLLQPKVVPAWAAYHQLREPDITPPTSPRAPPKSRPYR